MKQTVPAHMMLIFQESNILSNKVIFIPNHKVFYGKDILGDVRKALSKKV